MREVNLSDYIWSNHEIRDIKREHLGEQMPVMAYRLFQYVIRDVLIKRFGKDEMIDIFRATGEEAGRRYAHEMLDLSLDHGAFIAQLQQSLRVSRIGILQFEQFNQETGEAVLTIREDLDCSGLPVLGETVCNYDEGFIAGVLSEYTKKKYVVSEIDCWAVGGRVCRFEAHIE